MNISFLLGAGFSVPDKYPTRSHLNKLLRKVIHKEIILTTEGIAMFSKGRYYPNDEGKIYKLFFEEFLNYYTSKIIPTISNYDYEAFYDFYQGFRFGKYKCYKFDEFMLQFRCNYNCEIDDKNLLREFHSIFSQLIAGELWRKPQRTNKTLNGYSKYNEFISFLEDIQNDYDKFFIHTLNHDLLFEELCTSEFIEKEFCDGFEYEGSCFYSTDNYQNKVQLKRFTNKFENKYCLYKLHGSIDFYVYNFKNIEYDMIRVPYGISSIDLMREYYVEGELKIDKCFWNYYPNFLSGTYSKVDSYQESTYYQPVFNHFINNLKKSDTLIIIGYGLGDFEINKHIIANFLSDKNKKMIIINPQYNNSLFLENSNVKYYGEGKGIQNIGDDLKKMLKNN